MKKPTLILSALLLAACDTDGESEGETVDPAELPFGGYVRWTIQDLFASGDADFYELPDDESYEPNNTETPLGTPINEDTYDLFIIDPEPGDPPAYIPLDPGPRVFVTGDGASITFEYDEAIGVWDTGFFEFDEPYPGGDWSVDLPGNADFPAETFQDVLVGYPSGATGLELIRNGDNVPTGLSWMALDGSQSAYAFFAALGPEGQLYPICTATLADDGESDIPPECVGMGDLGIPEGFNTFSIRFGQTFETDVAYGAHRLRFSVAVGSQNDMPYPFEPAG